MPDLPFYPPSLASERKKAINAVVSQTSVGETPRIPEGYLSEENLMWKALYRQVTSVASQHACREYLDALINGAAYCPDTIPDLECLSARLHRMTGWQVAPVTGTITSEQFFAHLEARQMPCTQYIRPHTKFAFTEDPDCIHEMLGHLPALFIPSWARLSQAFGSTARRLIEQGEFAKLEQLEVMYFAVMEKGLVHQDGEVKAVGASVISGSGELVHAMEHPEKHLPLDPALVMEYGSTCETDFMKHFFVGDSVDSMAAIVTDWMSRL